MKNSNLLNRLLSYSHEKQSPQRFARYAAILIMLLTLGVGQMWGGNAGYVGNNESYFKNYVEYSKNGGSATQFKVDGSGQSDLALGVVSSLTLTQYGVGMYQDEDNLNGKESDKFCYWIHQKDDSSEDWTEVTGNWQDFDTYGWSGYGSWRHPGFGHNNLGINVLDGLGAGEYKLTFYFKHQGNSNWGNAWLYLSNGGSNYNITFTIAPVVTFKANGGSESDYTQTVTYNTNTALTANTFTKTNYDFAGWATSADGSVVYADGADVKLTAHTTLYAKWTPQTYSITYKDQGNVTYSGSNSALLPSSYTYGTGIASLTDGVKSGYRFDGWFDNSSCTGSAVTSISSSDTGAKTFYAKWTENPGGTVTLTAGTGGEVSKDGSSWGASTSYSGIKSATPLNIYAQANKGYTFNTWTRSSGSGTITTNAATGVFTPVADADAALTASFTENMSSLTTSNSYDAGDPSYAAPSVSGSATTVGYATTRTITAASAGTGYTFTGWTLTNCTRTDGGGATANPITVRSNGDGAAVTAQANYEEDLNSTWKIIGQSPSDKANSPFSSWTYASSTNTMAKATGHSTESVVYATISVPAASVTGNYYEFKVTGDGSTLYGYGENGEDNITFDVTKTNQTVYSNSNNDHALRFKPNVAGDYTFKVDYSGTDPKVSVTFPASYTVNFGVSPTGAASAPTNDKSVSNGGLVLSGTSVTFTHEEANTGYTWSHWEKNSSNVGTADTYTTTIDGNTTITAVYTEDTHTVTVGKTEGGSINVSSVSAGVATASATITATPANLAWRFKNWTVPDGVTIASGSETTASITILATADSKTITANFEPRYGLVGSRMDGTTQDGMPLWNDAEAADFVVTSYTDKDNMSLTCTRTLSANKDYKFQVYDRESKSRRGGDNDAKMTLGNSWKLTGSGVISFDTKGAGDYTFQITKIDDSNYQPSIQINAVTSYTVTFGYGTGGSAVTATGSVSGSITSGQYVAAGENITFTQTAAEGYTFKGWYDAASGGSAISSMTSDNVLDNIAADATVYAQYTENLCTVTITANDKTKGSIVVGGDVFDWDETVDVGVYTTKALIVTPVAGYYFAGWTLSTSPDFSVDDAGESGASTNLRGIGGTHGSTGTLTANFVEEDKIYFRNIFDDGAGNVSRWENVYVYFGITWDDNNVKTNNDASYIARMTKIEGKDVYVAHVPRAFSHAIGEGKGNVAFADTEFSANYTFYNATASGTKAASRGDYSKLLNMFVPNHTVKNTNYNGVDYFDNGYWMKYDTRASQGAGYYLKKYNSRNNYTQEGEFIATADDATAIRFKARIDNISAEYTRFMIVSAGGLNYLANATVTAAAYNNINVFEDLRTLTDHDVYFQLTVDTEGDYTFILDQSGDVMKLTVDYPVSVGDYRLMHTYNDGSDKTTYSDVIKANDASTPHTLSMYLSTEGSGTLVLQKCTAIVAGVPAWDAGNATNLSGVLTTVGTNGNGVYQFDVSVSADKVAEAPTATKYAGPYYIKTDGATGGWVNYTQNSMTENTLNFDAEYPEKSFNYYYCKYFSSDGANLKCVIANDYCNALTDTLIGDAVIGMDNQTTPSAVSVRFSYNSYTNEIKRSYLGASTTGDFLCVLGNTTDGKPHIYDKAETTHDDSHADAYIKFEDKQNWQYEIEINADINARAKLTATFNNQTQYFMGAAGESGQEWDDANTEQLFAGKSGTYGLTLVYDFKTNKLIRAWRPTASPINADLSLESDVILLREHQGAPTAITFGKKNATDYASLTEVKTVYSVLRLNRWKLSNRAHPEDVDIEHCKTADLINTHHKALSPENDGYLPQAERELYFISFPYDVKMSDIIHFGGYYDKWGIMYYDGKNRAKNGYWIDSESNWKYFTPEEFATGTLNAYEGYLIGIDLAAMWYDNTSFWTNNSSEVDIYFPSKEPVSTITQQEVTVPIDTVGYQCTINRTYGGNDGDRRIKDSHWHCIGVPAYANLTQASTHTGEPDKNTNWKTDNLLYIYSWRPATNDHVISDAGSFTFNAMYAYLVQYSQPTLSWAAAAVSPATPAARRMKTEELRDRQFNLQLMQGGKEADHTYIRLSDDEEVTTGFEFNHDVSKMMLNGANIYTLIGKEQAAANSLPLNMTQTTVVPVGVKIATAGDYTFAIPEGTDGVGVVLIDNIAGTRTNLALTDYEVSLTSGKIEDRFVLEISPISQISTDVETISDQHSAVRKVMIDGLLYIVKDGVVYDAQGKRVQ